MKVGQKDTPPSAKTDRPKPIDKRTRGASETRNQSTKITETLTSPKTAAFSRLTPQTKTNIQLMPHPIQQTRNTISEMQIKPKTQSNIKIKREEKSPSIAKKKQEYPNKLLKTKSEKELYQKKNGDLGTDIKLIHHTKKKSANDLIFKKSADPKEKQVVKNNGKIQPTSPKKECPSTNKYEGNLAYPKQSKDTLFGKKILAIDIESLNKNLQKQKINAETKALNANEKVSTHTPEPTKTKYKSNFLNNLKSELTAKDLGLLKMSRPNSIQVSLLLEFYL